jgi:integrase
MPLPDLVARPRVLARVLREPHQPIARATGRARLVAIQRFIQLLGPSLGQDPDAVLAMLDSLLPMRPAVGWHSTGTVLAGSLGRRRRAGPVIAAADLRSIVDTARCAGSPYRAARNGTLVALQCFSGLRVEEIVRLRWQDLATELTPTGYYGLTAHVSRAARHLQLLIPGPAAEAIGALAQHHDGEVADLTGPVIRAGERSARPMSYRAARSILRDACLRTGLPPMESAELRAACAHWLRAQGLSDHEVAAVLGLVRVRSVDRMLRRHAAIDAQRRAREVLG